MATIALYIDRGDTSTPQADMATAQLQTLLRHMRRLAVSRSAAGASDAQLLGRFVTERDELAFELLIWRHGSMVLSACRRVLRHDQDAEDSFQATFLALARKARSIGKRQSLASWLYKVAIRIALQAKRNREKEWRRAKTAWLPSRGQQVHDVLVHDIKRVVDEEIGRLPERYRAAVILCYLEGKTYDEAARLLGCPRGTISIRLMRARERLRVQLTRRGLTLSSAALAAVLSPSHVNAAALSLLVNNIVRSVSSLRPGITTAAAGASPSVAALVEGVIKAMFLSKLKVIASVLLLSVVAAGGALTTYKTAVAGPAPAAAEGPARISTDQTDEERVKEEVSRLEEQLERVKRELVRLEAGFRFAEVPSPSDGTILFIGTEIKEEEEVPPERVLSIKVGEQVKKYRRLKLGDVVKRGQMVAQLDDQLARHDVKVKQAKLQVAKAELMAAEKSAQEAFARYNTQTRLWHSEKGRASTEEELGRAELLWQKSSQRATTGKAEVAAAEAELSRAQSVLERHQLDDQLARHDVEVKQAKLQVAKAALAAAEKTAKESLESFQNQTRLWQSERRPATTEEELRGAKQLWQKSSYDAVSKKAAVAAAEAELGRAQSVLERHQIHSSVNGVIRKIYKEPGEAVKYLEPVMRIRVLDD
jgi:HlyD family secretion protein